MLPWLSAPVAAVPVSGVFSPPPPQPAAMTIVTSAIPAFHFQRLIRSSTLSDAGQAPGFQRILPPIANLRDYSTGERKTQRKENSRIDNSDGCDIVRSSKEGIFPEHTARTKVRSCRSKEGRESKDRSKMSKKKRENSGPSEGRGHLDTPPPVEEVTSQDGTETEEEEKTRLYVLPTTGAEDPDELLTSESAEPIDFDEIQVEPLGEEIDTSVESLPEDEETSIHQGISSAVGLPTEDSTITDGFLDENPMNLSAVRSATFDDEPEDDSEKTVLLHDAFSAVEKGEITDSFQEINPQDYGRIQYTDRNGQLHEFILDKERCKVGRFDDSEIYIPDESVSRNHAEIVIEGTNFFINDLGSLNKTRVNGKVIKARRALKHRDKIAFGDVEALFLAPGYDEDAAPPKPKRSLGPIDRKMLIGGGVVLTLVMAFSIYLSRKQIDVDRYKISEPTPRDTAQKSNEQPRKDPKQLLIQVNNLYEEGKWDQALSLLDEIQRNYPPYAAEAASYIQRIRIEKENEQKLQMANALIQDEYYEPALKILREIDPSSRAAASANYLIAEVESNTKVIEERKKKEEAATLVDRGEKAYKTGNYSQAKRFADKALSLVPDDAAALDLQQRAAERLARIRRTRRPPRKVETASTPKPKKTKPFPENIEDPELKKLFFEGLDLYYKGENDKAVTFFLKLYQAKPKEIVGQKAAEYAKNIRTVKENSLLGKRYLKKGNFEKAATYFGRAYEADAKIYGHESGKQYKSLREAYIMALANYADYLFEVGKFPQAKKAWDKALRLDPTNLKAKAGIAKLEVRAKERYQAAYLLADTDPEAAVRIWQEILSIVDPSNEYYQKAQERLKRIE
ncbi:MAG: FHA domain-containing protein [Deltaproteobacteria bacterium]|nr:MAG: FHA domain-containing protein [Deltaproteobacteria bacterium]